MAGVEDPVRIDPIEDPARRLDNLSVPPAEELSGLGSTPRMLGELVDMPKDALDQGTSGIRIF